MNGTRQNGRPGPARPPWFFARASGAVGGAGRRRRVRAPAAAADPTLAARAPVEAGDALRRRSARGSLSAAHVRLARSAPTAATASPAADAAAIETRRDVRARAPRWSRRSCSRRSPVAPVRAEDHVTVRGAYYREASTRVIQPVVEISKDLPSGFDVTAHYLLDAITSASVAAGTASDTIFTEMRNEVGLAVGRTWDRWRFDAGLLVQRGVGLLVARRLGLGAPTASGATARRVGGQRRHQLRRRLAAHAHARLPDGGADMICKLRSYFGSLSYTQVWSPTFADPGRRRGRVPRRLSGQPLPGGAQPRLREGAVDALARRADRRAPRTTSRARSTGLQLHYRYYRDDWDIDAHMIEGRVYQPLTRDLEVRASYRYYTQTPAYFWCDWMARPDCYGAERDALHGGSQAAARAARRCPSSS